MWDDYESYVSDREEDNKCEECGATEFEDEVQLVYDEDGKLLCTDCFFEQESMKSMEDEDDAEDYV